MRRLLPLLGVLVAAGFSAVPGPALAATGDLTVQVGIAPPLQGQATCSGDACTGLDPFMAGCANDAAELEGTSELVLYNNQVVAINELE